MVSGTFGSFLVATLAAGLAQGAVVPKSAPVVAQQVKNPEFVGHNGFASLARTQTKYGLQPSMELLSAAEDLAFENLKAFNLNLLKRDSGNQTAKDVGSDSEWVVPVQIGTPAQTVNLDFDTGSSDLWVFTDESPSKDQQTHNIYKPGSSSSSSKMQGATWNIRYGTGSEGASGDVYTDTVSVGDLTFAKQAVESAKKITSGIATPGQDGLLGLAFSSINEVKPTPQKTWFDNVGSDLDSNICVADLRHNAAGAYYFGALPSDAGDVAYAPVDDSQGYWLFDTKINGGASSQAIADTGTTLIMIDASAVKEYYSGASGVQQTQGYYVVDCSKTDLPDFTFTVGEKTITVPGKSMTSIPANNAGTVCLGGAQSNEGIGLNILGDVAMKDFYVVYDQANTQVGWADKPTA